MPTAIPPQPQKPPMPPMPLPPIQRTLPPKEGITAENAVNPFERVAALLIDEATARATQLAANLSEAPANSHELTPDEIKAMWFYTTQGSPTQADAKFWEVHDEVLQQTGDHNEAETQAMKAAYPYRPILTQMGNANAEKQVAMAEAIRRQVDGDQRPTADNEGQAHIAYANQVRQAGGNV